MFLSSWNDVIAQDIFDNGLVFGCVGRQPPWQFFSSHSEFQVGSHTIRLSFEFFCYLLKGKLNALNDRLEIKSLDTLILR